MQGISSFVILLVLPVVAFYYRAQLMPIAKFLYAKYLAFQARRSGTALPKQPPKFKKPGKESSQSEFDFLPPGLSNFSSKSKHKSKTK